MSLTTSTTYQSIQAVPYCVEPEPQAVIVQQPMPEALAEPEPTCTVCMPCCRCLQSCACCLETCFIILDCI